MDCEFSAACGLALARRIRRRPASAKPQAANNEGTLPMPDSNTLTRWRLMLGKYAQPKLPQGLSADQERMAAALEMLYGREYKGRGVRQDAKLGPGSLDPSQLNVTTWLNEIRELFPKKTCERI